MKLAELVATSEPDAMAMLTSAAAKAGESSTPSPTKATIGRGGFELGVVSPSAGVVLEERF